jgi:Cdc6-like AAA superfamily ATPase
MTEGRYILDLTRPEGAGTLEETFFLYSYVEQIENIIKEFLEYDNNNRNRDANIVEFYSTNIFINGERGVGKTSVLLTIYDHLQRNQELEVLPIIDLSTNVQSILIYLLAYLKKKYYELLDSESCCDGKLDELFYNLEVNFPIFLKCFCNSSCEIICKEDISSLLEKNEIEFLKNLHIFIDKLLRTHLFFLISKRQ